MFKSIETPTEATGEPSRGLLEIGQGHRGRRLSDL